MNEQHYAVVVGINNYPDDEIETLNSPVGDARKFAEWLVSPDGGKLLPENLREITEDNLGGVNVRKDGKPTKTEIHEALFELASLCKNHVKHRPQDWAKTRLYVYLSGHGIAPVPNEAALLMANAGPDWFGENFPCGSFLEYYEEAQYFKELVFFADCCRDWVEDAPLAGPTWTKVEGNNGKVKALRGYATYFGDPAYEPPKDQLEPGDERRSFFTKALIEGLEGKAVDPHNRRIDSISLATYVKARVLKLTENKKAPQEPQFPGDIAEPIIFRENISTLEVEDARTQLVNIELTSGFNGEVVLVNGNLTEIERHATVPDPWHIHLKRGLYQLKPADESLPNPFENDGFIKVLGEDIHVKV